MIDGVTYRIDVSQPSRFDAGGKIATADASRIVELAHNGQPVRPDQEFVVVTNNYRASGGGNFPGNDGTTIVLDAPDPTRDVIIRYFQQTGTLDVKADGNWSLRPVPGARNVTFESNPKGRDAMQAFKGLSFVGEGQNGFAKYRLDLSA